MQLVDLLKPVEKCWQAQDFMPDPSSPTFLDEVRHVGGSLCVRCVAAWLTTALCALRSGSCRSGVATSRTTTCWSLSAT